MARSNAVTECGINATGNMTFSAVGYHDVAVLDVPRLCGDDWELMNQFARDAAYHGCKQKVHDAAAGKKGKEAFVAMKAVVDTLNRTGNFGTRVSISQAQVDAMKAELDAALAKLREHGLA